MNAIVERLVGAGAQIIVEAIVGAALTLGAVLIAGNLARRGRVWIGSGAGRTCTSPYVLLVGVLSGVAAATCLALGLLDPESLRETTAFKAWAALISAFSLGFLASIVSSRQTWEWDAAGLRWRGAWRHVSIPWSELARIGSTWGGRFFAADKAGRRIYWSHYTLEHEALRDAILKARPDLVVP